MTERTCSVDGCMKPARYAGGIGHCAMHAERWRKHKTVEDPRSFDRRLWSRIEIDAAGCWIWTGGRTIHGYGQIMEDGKNLRVHRVVWEKLRGPIPDGMHLCHTCDNPPCCNPAHLFVGDHRANMRDMAAKGRGVATAALPPDEYTERMQSLAAKVCPRCGTVKPPDAFGPNKARADGLQVYCRPCYHSYKRERSA